jgi:hypothetical protein
VTTADIARTATGNKKMDPDDLISYLWWLVRKLRKSRAYILEGVDFETRQHQDDPGQPDPPSQVVCADDHRDPGARGNHHNPRTGGASV